VLLCRAICTGGWDPCESHLFLNFLEGGAKTYFLNMGSHGEMPKLPERGLTNSQELNAMPSVKLGTAGLNGIGNEYGRLFLYPRNPMTETYFELTVL
jgi:hypothetical protein